MFLPPYDDCVLLRLEFEIDITIVNLVFTVGMAI